MSHEKGSSHQHNSLDDLHCSLDDVAFCGFVSRLAGAGSRRSYVGIHFYNGVQHGKDVCEKEISSGDLGRIVNSAVDLSSTVCFNPDVRH